MQQRFFSRKRKKHNEESLYSSLEPLFPQLNDILDLPESEILNKLTLYLTIFRTILSIFSEKKNIGIEVLDALLRQLELLNKNDYEKMHADLQRTFNDYSFQSSEENRKKIIYAYIKKLLAAIFKRIAVQINQIKNLDSIGLSNAKEVLQSAAKACVLKQNEYLLKLIDNLFLLQPKSVQEQLFDFNNEIVRVEPGAKEKYLEDEAQASHALELKQKLSSHMQVTQKQYSDKIMIKLLEEFVHIFEAEVFIFSQLIELKSSNTSNMVAI